MAFIDVVFPLNLGQLTYKCPDHLIERALPGMLVSAPLKNQITRGVMLGKSSNPESATIKPISDIHGESPLLESSMLKLLEWMSAYYLANKGLILKNMLAKEAFNRVKARKYANPFLPQPAEGGQEAAEGSGGRGLIIDGKILSGIIESAADKEYKTFLLHAPTFLYEISAITNLLQSIQPKSSIIIVPEITHINYVACFIKEAAGERLCIMHSGLSSGQRSDALEKILSGKCSVVLGTRAAVFAPIKNVSLIAVMQEHNSSYKTEEGLRYNARDIAVMRGFLEKTTVVLTSICPSMESIHNAKQNKYTLLQPDLIVRRPRIKVINMFHEKKPILPLSKTVIDAAAAALKKNGRVMFVINRKGYSMLMCSECNYTETCDRCGIPLIFHKDDKSIRCHFCGSRTSPLDKCKRCGSFHIELIGSGIQRIEEDIKKLFAVQPLRLDSDRAKRKRTPDNLAEIIKGETIIIGTKLLTKRLHAAVEFGMAAVLNADSYLNQPDFRSVEKTFQEFTAIADKMMPEGRLFIQTRMPQNYLFKFLKNYDYNGFCQEELARRKAMSYPPYSKLALISLKGKDCHDDKTRDAIKPLIAANEGLEVFGPSLSLDRKGRKEYSLLLKATSKNKLHSFAKELLRQIEGCRNLKIRIAFDP